MVHVETCYIGQHWSSIFTWVDLCYHCFDLVLTFVEFDEFGFDWLRIDIDQWFDIGFLVFILLFSCLEFMFCNVIKLALSSRVFGSALFCIDQWFEIGFHVLFLLYCLDFMFCNVIELALTSCVFGYAVIKNDF